MENKDDLVFVIKISDEGVCEFKNLYILYNECKMITSFSRVEKADINDENVHIVPIYEAAEFVKKLTLKNLDETIKKINKELETLKQIKSIFKFQ